MEIYKWLNCVPLKWFITYQPILIKINMYHTVGNSTVGNSTVGDSTVGDNSSYPLVRSNATVGLKFTSSNSISKESQR